mmetsp:Transcript_126018/g.228718  ORF Transcript_126018/g.228718 Transcript_126018/m.228718 type:complete len:205 (-) Transcript_126018:828-1442(-)
MRVPPRQRDPLPSQKHVPAQPRPSVHIAGLKAQVPRSWLVHWSPSVCDTTALHPSSVVGQASSSQMCPDCMHVVKQSSSFSPSIQESVFSCELPAGAARVTKRFFGSDLVTSDLIFSSSLSMLDSLSACASLVLSSSFFDSTSVLMLSSALSMFDSPSACDLLVSSTSFFVDSLSTCDLRVSFAEVRQGQIRRAIGDGCEPVPP